MSETLPLAQRKTALYRYFRAGSLLYVGISHDPFIRAMKHGQRAAWYQEIDEMRVEWYDTRAEALNAESQAILLEQPSCNIIGKSKDARVGTVSSAGESKLGGWVSDASPPVGRYGHLPLKGGGYNQFYVVSRIDKKHYLVMLFEWGMGNPNGEEVWSRSKLLNARLYSDPEEWRWAGDQILIAAERRRLLEERKAAADS